MELMYMQKLKNWDDNKNWKKTSVKEDAISFLEDNHSIKFPLAYREYLSVSGIYCPAIVQGHRFEFLEEKQSDALNLLKEYKLSHLISKPIWVIATSGDSDSFWYFHLDEGDNPAVYRLSCMYYEEYPDEKSFGKVADSFQDWIEQAIKYYEEDPENE